MVVRLQIKINGEGREEFIACPLIDRGVKLIKILQKCNTVISFVTSSFLWGVLCFFRISFQPPLRLYFYFFYVPVCAMNDLFAACQHNATTYGSHWLAESHNAEMLANLIMKVLLKFFSNFLYRGGGCHYQDRLERVLFALVALTLVFLWEVR